MPLSAHCPRNRAYENNGRNPAEIRIREEEPTGGPDSYKTSVHPACAEHLEPMFRTQGKRNNQPFTEMNKILVIGSTNIDLIARVEHLPRPGETVGEAQFMQSNGGKGANQAVAAARLGGDVGFVSCLGDDAGADALRRQFAADGIHTDALVTIPDTPTGTALIYVSQDGENCIAVAPGANRHLTRERIDEAAARIAGAEYLLIQLEIPMDTIVYAVEKAWQAGTKVVLNPAPAMELPEDLLRKVYLLTPNRTECETLTGLRIDTPDAASQAAARLLARGVGQVIVTLGSDGALIRTPAFEERIPACRVTPVDTTAAGDVFNGALLVALAEGKSLVDAVRFATRCAAVSVTRMGAQTSIPWRREIAGGC